MPMWENENPIGAKTEEEKANIKQNIVAGQQERQSEGILLIQIFLCVAIILFVLLIRSFSTELFLNIKTEYKAIMNNGVDLSGQTELIRFANAAISDIRAEVSRIFSKLDTPNSQGGAQAVKGNTIPDNASSLRYQLTDKPFCPANGKQTSSFGFRKNPITHKKDFHTGIDIAAEKGSGVYASFTGVAEKIGKDKIRGNFIIIKHSNELKTLYQHLDKIKIKENAIIKRAEVIGTVGSTGFSTGSHLHFEIIINGKSVNPVYAIVLDRL
ncbi:MAG: M23 family metallopeptidase [Oscillospiraceae bacterium]